MNKSEKVMFSGASKRIRKLLTSIRKEGRTFFVMRGEVPRPDMVTLTDGRRVKYTGP